MNTSARSLDIASPINYMKLWDQENHDLEMFKNIFWKSNEIFRLETSVSGPYSFEHHSEAEWKSLLMRKFIYVMIEQMPERAFDELVETMVQMYEYYTSQVDEKMLLTSNISSIDALLSELGSNEVLPLLED